MQETRVRSLGWEDPLEKGKAPHSRILGFPGGSEVKASASNAGDPGSILGREDKVFIEFVTVWFLFYVLCFL